MTTATDDNKAAMTASESALAKIWKDALRVEKLEPGANFFDAGGDSLMVMDVIARVREELGVELPLMAFFEDPTIPHLASVIDELGGGATSPAITRASDRTEFPLSHSQEVFWLLEQQHPGTGLYNTARVFRIHGDPDPAILERAFNEMVRRNAILRVRIVSGPNGPVQIVQDSPHIGIPTADMSDLPAESREKAAVDLALETIHQPFDLTTAPVVRARFIRIAPDESLLCMAIHHVVSDGFTGSLLLDEWGAIYDAFAGGQTLTLPEPEFQFTDYAAAEREQMAGARLATELEYWRNALAPPPPLLKLPTDFPQPVEPDHKGRHAYRTLTADETQRIRLFAQSNGTTLFTALNATVRLLLYRWTGATDFSLGTIAANRSRPGTERMMGCFVNPIPLRNPITPGQTVRDLMIAESKAIMDAFAHQDCPFASIVDAVNPERSGADNPLFNVATMLQNFPAIRYQGRYFTAEGVDLDAGIALLDLRFFAIENGGELELSCEYKTSLFRDSTAIALLDTFVSLLKRVSTEPGTVVESILLPEGLSRDERVGSESDAGPLIAVASSFSAHPLEEQIQSLLDELDMNYRLQFAPHRQVLDQLRSPGSILRAADGFGVVVARLEDMITSEAGCDLRVALERASRDLTSAIQAAAPIASRLIVCLCPPSRGLIARVGSDSLEALERHVASAFPDSSSVCVITSKEVLNLYPVENYEDDYALRLTNIPYASAFFSALGRSLVRRLWSIAENPYTAIVADSAAVRAHELLGQAVARQKEAGKALYICEEDGAPASERLAEFSRRFEFDLARCIYLTADPRRAAEAEASHPEILALEVPEQRREIPEWLRHVWAFDLNAR